MHTVAILALEDVVSFDLAVPLETFGRTRLADGGLAYEVRVCGPSTEVEAGGFGLRLRHGLEAIAAADTVVVPGVADLDRPVPAAVSLALQAAWARGARVASVCTGAFVLAAAGLLDGQRATTHWAAATELARRHPLVAVDPDVLFVDNGRLLTSAGAAAGLDLCLHMVRLDHGASVAAGAARLAVMPLERAGGQAQFITHVPPEDGSLAPLLGWLEEHAARELSLGAIARQAAMSVRTLNRRFQEQTGTTPRQWLLRARIRRAQALLETTSLPIDQIAREVGFASAITFRERFKHFLATSPSAYRQALASQGANPCVS